MKISNSKQQSVEDKWGKHVKQILRVVNLKKNKLVLARLISVVLFLTLLVIFLQFPQGSIKNIVDKNFMSNGSTGL